MKDVTAEYIPKYKEKLEKEKLTYFSYGEERHVPNWTVKAFLNLMRVYEASDVKDVTDNYDLLRKKRMIPIQFVGFAASIALRNLTNPIAMHAMEEDEKNLPEFNELLGDSRFSPRTSAYNTGTLYGVYLRNFEPIRGKVYRGYNFDILDNKGAKIRGIYVYELSTSLAFQGTNKRGENDEREQMTEALQADDNATFSISFSALDPKRMVAIKGGLRDRDNMPIKVPRGKVLHVDDISRDGGGKELDPIIPLVRR